MVSEPVIGISLRLKNRKNFVWEMIVNLYKILK
jgi:hypothetical protein